MTEFVFLFASMLIENRWWELFIRSNRETNTNPRQFLKREKLDSNHMGFLYLLVRTQYREKQMIDLLLRNSLWSIFFSLFLLSGALPTTDHNFSLIPHISAPPAHGQLSLKGWQCGCCPSPESLQLLPRSISAPQTCSNVLLIKGLIAWPRLKHTHRYCGSHEGKKRPRLF